MFNATRLLIRYSILTPLLVLIFGCKKYDPVLALEGEYIGTADYFYYNSGMNDRIDTTFNEVRVIIKRNHSKEYRSDIFIYMPNDIEHLYLDVPTHHNKLDQYYGTGNRNGGRSFLLEGTLDENHLSLKLYASESGGENFDIKIEATKK